MLVLGFAACLLLATGCSATPHERNDTGLRGTLLAIGGGLDDDNAPVFQRFVELAAQAARSKRPSAAGAPADQRGPCIVVVTAATGDQDVMATGKVAALQTWWPGLTCTVVRRETPTTATVAAIDGASALFFTGGDQKRIVDRYRPGDTDSPEWLAMQRLLHRGGVIAGSSAGLAMMSDVMFLTGRSAAALGVRPRPAPDSAGDAVTLGPQLGPGMHFVPWLVTDSHFFERDRIGRLVAGLEASQRRLGLGVGEDGCVEIDLATGVVSGIAVSESLLVDIGGMVRDGSARRRCAAIRIRQGTCVSLLDVLQTPPAVAPRPAQAPTPEVVVEEGQHRQLASWRLFARASQGGVWQLALDGWRITAWPNGAGAVAFDIDVDPPPGS